MGPKLNAKLIGTDSIADLAVVKVDGNMPAPRLWAIRARCNLDRLAIAIGSPLGDFRGQ